jgi:hypothetical protein
MKTKAKRVRMTAHSPSADLAAYGMDIVNTQTYHEKLRRRGKTASEAIKVWDAVDQEAAEMILKSVSQGSESILRNGRVPSPFAFTDPYAPCNIPSSSTSANSPTSKCFHLPRHIQTTRRPITRSISHQESRPPPSPTRVPTDPPVPQSAQPSLTVAILQPVPSLSITMRATSPQRLVFPRHDLSRKWTLAAESAGARPVYIVNEVDDELPPLVDNFIYTERRYL